jgi:membrane protein
MIFPCCGIVKAMEMNKHKGQYNFWAMLVKQFFAQSLFTQAGAITCTTLLSVVPLMIVSFSIIAVLPGAHHLMQATENLIFKNFIPESGAVLQQNFEKFFVQARKLPVISLLFLVAVSISLLFSIERAFNNIWGVRHRRERILKHVYYWIIIVFAFLVMLITLGSTSYLLALPPVAELLQHWGLSLVALDFIAFLLTAFVFALLYKLLPNCYVSSWFALLSGVVASVLFLIAKYIFLAYVTFFPTYKILYGALATIPIFILWIFISWSIVLFGVLLSSVLTNRC